MYDAKWYLLRWLRYWTGLLNSLIGILTFGCKDAASLELRSMDLFLDYDIISRSKDVKNGTN